MSRDVDGKAWAVSLKGAGRDEPGAPILYWVARQKELAKRMEEGWLAGEGNELPGGGVVAAGVLA